MNNFSVVGIGPGHLNYIIPRSLKAIEEADILIGGRCQLDTFSYLMKEEKVLKGNYPAVFSYIKSHYTQKKIALLVSGDPGYHSLLGRISESFSSDQYIVYPGISSFQLALSRIGQVWNNASLLSFHGKNISDVHCPRSGMLVLLTDYKNTPKIIADDLLSRGFENRKVYIAENLSYENERIAEVRLADITEEEYKLCVMIIE